MEEVLLGTREPMGAEAFRAELRRVMPGVHAALAQARALRERMAKGEGQIVQLRDWIQTETAAGRPVDSTYLDRLRAAEGKMTGLREELRQCDAAELVGVGAGMAWGLAAAISEEADDGRWSVPPGSTLTIDLPGVIRLSVKLDERFPRANGER